MQAQAPIRGAEGRVRHVPKLWEARPRPCRRHKPPLRASSLDTALRRSSRSRHRLPYTCKTVPRRLRVLHARPKQPQKPPREKTLVTAFTPTHGTYRCKNGTPVNTLSEHSTHATVYDGVAKARPGACKDVESAQCSALSFQCILSAGERQMQRGARRRIPIQEACQGYLLMHTGERWDTPRRRYPHSGALKDQQRVSSRRGRARTAAPGPATPTGGAQAGGPRRFR